MSWLSSKSPWQRSRNCRWIVLVGVALVFACVVGFDAWRLPAVSKLGAERSYVTVKPKTSRTSTKDIESPWDDDNNTVDPQCIEYPEVEPILLPTSRNSSSVIIDRLRESIGNSSFDSIFANCPVTTQVQIIHKCPYWELQTLDYKGNPKTVGGDEFYITYTDQALYQALVFTRTGTPPMLDPPFHTLPFTAAAWITDLNNGRYRLKFQASPLSMQSQRGRGIFAVYFHYTCNIGRMGPPSKENWTDGGNSVAAYRTKILPLVPPIRPFQPPTSTGNDGFGRPNLWNYDAIIPVGDSLLQNLLSPLRIEFKNVNSALNTSTLHNWKIFVRQAYRTYGGNGTNLVFVLGSCVWDVLEVQTVPTSTMDRTIGWLDHQKALRSLLQSIWNRYPNATFFWRSCSSVHLHVPHLANFTGLRLRGMQERTKYMSTSRALQLYTIQKQIIHEEMEAFQAFEKGDSRLFYLDVYSPYFLSANHALAGDGRHYREEINREIVKWFVNDTLVRNDQ